MTDTTLSGSTGDHDLDVTLSLGPATTAQNDPDVPQDRKDLLLGLAEGALDRDNLRQR